MFISHPNHELLITHQNLQARRAEAAEHRLVDRGTTGHHRARLTAFVVVFALTAIAAGLFQWQHTTEAIAPPDRDELLLRGPPRDSCDLGCKLIPGRADGWFDSSQTTPPLAGGGVVEPVFRPVWVHFG